MATEPQVRPEDFNRRSVVYRKLQRHGAVFREAFGAAADNFGDATGEAAAARTLGLADLSTLPRIGFRGPGALAWLRERSVSGLDADHRGELQEGGAVAARLAPSEALILDDPAGTGSLCDRLDFDWSRTKPQACHVAPRRDASFWFVLTGDRTAPTLAKLCGVDLRPDRFADLTLAQTSVARLSAVVLRWDMGRVPAYHLLGDCASGEYFWDCLNDAMAEHDGRPVGLSALEIIAAG